MKKLLFYENVNYDALTLDEKRNKASRELFTIFHLNGNRGLTDMEIHSEALKLNMNGYDSYAPDSVVRSMIYRWNDIAIRSKTGGLKCLHPSCKKFGNWGLSLDELFCKKHKTSIMLNLIEERVIKMPKVNGNTKGKYYLNESFALTVFGENYVPIPQPVVIDTDKVSDETASNCETEDFDIDQFLADIQQQNYIDDIFLFNQW